MESLKNIEVDRRKFLKSVIAGYLAWSWGPLELSGIALAGTIKESRDKRILRAFVETVLPGLDVTQDNAVQIFYDSTLPLARLRTFFTSDLVFLSQITVGDARFDQLKVEDRAKVIHAGLNSSKEIQVQAYTGAVFAAQLSNYAGIYDDVNGSPLIGYPGQFQFPGWDQMIYAETSRFRAQERTSDGNFS